MKFISILVFIFILSSSSHSSRDNNESYFDMSLEDLLDVKLFTPTKSLEKSFESYQSVSVITSDHILRSGVSNLEELFRLVPGIIVREVSPGNYDIHIRGLDYVTNHYYHDSNYDFTFRPSILDSKNYQTLVMLDGRVLYNAFQGATYWQMASVPLHQIDRIEIVRGPTSALNGANAANGAIHIFTKKRKSNNNGWSQIADISVGQQNYQRYSVSSNYNSKNTYFNLSAKSFSLNRIDEEYLTIKSNLSNTNADRTDKPDKYPDPLRAIRQNAIHYSLGFKTDNSYLIEYSGGHTRSVQHDSKVDTFVTVLTTSDTSDYYQSLKLQKGSWEFRYDYSEGDTHLLGDSLSSVNSDYIKYNSKLIKLFDSITYDASLGIEYSYQMQKGEYLKGKETSHATSLFGKYDYQLNKDLKVISALRLDHYRHPKRVYSPYNLGALYRLSKNENIRFNHSLANRAPYFLDMYMDFGSSSQLIGDNKLLLPQTKLYELGYRKRWEHLSVDFEVFHQILDNLIARQGSYISGASAQNLDLTVKQTGITTELKHKDGAWVNSIYLTVQKTSHENEHESSQFLYTPEVYGGILLDYKFNDKFHLFQNYYYLSAQEVKGYNSASSSDKFYTDKIEAKVLGSLNLSYQQSKDRKYLVGIKNIFNNPSREFYRADKNSRLIYTNLTQSF